jgi:hypothetical protein
MFLIFYLLLLPLLYPLRRLSIITPYLIIKLNLSMLFGCDTLDFEVILVNRVGRGRASGRVAANRRMEF